MKVMKIYYCGAGKAQIPSIVISILDMLFALVVLAFLAYLTHMYASKPEELETTVQRIDPQRTGNLANFLQYSASEQVILLIFPFVTNSIGLLMAVFLFISSIKMHDGALQVWFILTMIFMILQIVVLVIQIASGRHAASFIIPPVVEFVYRIYSLFIVRCFILEINSVEEESTKSEETVEEGGDDEPGEEAAEEG